MDEKKVMVLIEILKTLTRELEDEIKPTTGSYSMSEEDYTEILKYVEEGDGIG